MNENQAQLTECLIDLAKRADELGESEIAHSLLIMSTAIVTGDVKGFKAMCVVYADMKLQEALLDVVKIMSDPKADEALKSTIDSMIENSAKLKSLIDKINPKND